MKKSQHVDYQALLTSAREKAFSLAGHVDAETASRCQSLIHQSIRTGASWHTTQIQLRTLFEQAPVIHQVQA
ncbi:hypothetical protein D3C85_1833850 [compost metagenome]